MTATIGPEMIDKILEGAIALADEYVDRLKGEYGGLGWQQQHISDEDHAKWFIMMTEQNPNWMLALPYVEGGMAELNRFKKFMEQDDAA